MLFLWQFPHFMAIAWMYREDYDRAGYQVLPHGKRTRDRFVDIQTLLPLMVLLPVNLIPAFAGKAGYLYGIGAALLSTGFLYYGAQLVLHRSNSAARPLLAASILYLPLLFVLMLVLEG
jgi:protoheme IX farnesyltransferase